jgi:hypothetical protein
MAGPAEPVVFSRPVVAVTQGQASVSIEVSLPRNAVVRTFDLVVEARRADEVALEVVADVRPNEDVVREAVVDFRMLRTVSGFRAPAGFAVEKIFGWTGTGFPELPLWPPRGTTGGTPQADFSEIRTERLLVVLDGAAPRETLLAAAVVVLPEAPADLELRIDGGPPVWTHPGPVVPGDGTEPVPDAWTVDGRRLVPLAAALAPLVGDPKGAGQASFRLILSSRVPGALALTEVGSEISFIHRARLGGQASRDLALAGEGTVLVEFDLPDLPETGEIEEVRCTVAGELRPERAVGSLEPTAPAVEGPPYPAELVADPDRAFCCKLPSHPRLAELSAVRLPLHAGAAGAEARVLLWEGDGEPERPVGAGASEPVTLAAEDGLGEGWTTFPFARPVALEAVAGGVAGVRPLWAALVVSRGSAAWGLGEQPAAPADGTDEGPRAAAHLRRGGPSGPWLPLPEVFQRPDGALQSLRARARVVGRADKAPLPPLRVRLKEASAAAAAMGSEAQEVSPAPRGVAVSLVLASPQAFGAPALELTSRAPGSITVRDVDVVWRQPI